MKTLSSYSLEPDERTLAAAVDAIRSGAIVIIPTGTLYALVCDALNNRAVERLCRIKDINPLKNLLSVIVADLSHITDIAKVDNAGFRLLKEYLPGPYTFILPAAPRLPKSMRGRRTIGIRIPENNFGPVLAREAGCPLLASSLSGGDDGELADATFAAEHYAAWPEVELTVDGGTGVAEPTTVVDCTDSSTPEVVRPGAGTFEE